MASLAVGRKNLFAAIVRREFGLRLGALRSGNFFHTGHLTSVRIKRLGTKISREPAEVSATKKYRQAVYCDQPDGKRFATHTRLAFLALHRGMDFVHISNFAVVHTLARMGLWWWSV